MLAGINPTRLRRVPTLENRPIALLSHPAQRLAELLPGNSPLDLSPLPLPPPCKLLLCGNGEHCLVTLSLVHSFKNRALTE